MIYYLVGDATRPEVVGKKIITHIVNDAGAWGAGFVVALSRRWPEAERAYRAWYSGFDWTYFGLGEVQFVEVENEITVANMVAQNGVRGGGRLVDYYALQDCLYTVSQRAKEHAASIHMPRIGCGLGGGKWEEVERLIKIELAGLSVYVYDLEVPT